MRMEWLLHVNNNKRVVCIASHLYTLSRSWQHEKHVRALYRSHSPPRMRNLFFHSDGVSGTGSTSIELYSFDIFHFFSQLKKFSPFVSYRYVFGDIFKTIFHFSQSTATKHSSYTKMLCYEKNDDVIHNFIKILFVLEIRSLFHHKIPHRYNLFSSKYQPLVSCV